MTETFRALVDLEWYGYLEEGTENYHEVILYSGETFVVTVEKEDEDACLLYTSPSPRDRTRSRMPSSA